MKDYSEIINNLGLTPKIAHELVPDITLNNWRLIFKFIREGETLSDVKREKLEHLINIASNN